METINLKCVILIRAHLKRKHATSAHVSLYIQAVWQGYIVKLKINVRSEVYIRTSIMLTEIGSSAIKHDHGPRL